MHLSFCSCMTPLDTGSAPKKYIYRYMYLYLKKGPERPKEFERYLLNSLYFVICYRRGNAYLNTLDLITPQ